MSLGEGPEGQEAAQLLDQLGEPIPEPAPLGHRRGGGCSDSLSGGGGGPKRWPGLPGADALIGPTWKRVLGETVTCTQRAGITIWRRRHKDIAHKVTTGTPMGESMFLIT